MSGLKTTVTFERVSGPQVGSPWDPEVPDPKDPAYVTRMIADRLDGEDDPDWGLFFYAADFKTGVDVTVLTEGPNGEDVTLAKYRLTITKLEDNK